MNSASRRGVTARAKRKPPSQEETIRQNNGHQPRSQISRFKHTNDRKEGRYFRGAGATQSVDSYDKPFDTAPELVRTGTTANYRMIHLQRLANPLLPWNPPPLLADGKTANPSTERIRPSIRTSRSIRPASISRPSTARAVANTTSIPRRKTRRERSIPEYRRYHQIFEPTTTANSQAWYFRSQERGYWSRLNLFGSNPPVGGSSPRCRSACCGRKNRRM